MNLSIDLYDHNNGADGIAKAKLMISYFDSSDPDQMAYFERVEPIFRRHALQINEEIRATLGKGVESKTPEWLSKPIHSGIYRDGKELILSGYYKDETGNEHFTLEEALEIEKTIFKTRGCRLPTKEDHEAIAEALFDREKWEWKENVCGTTMNGFDYLTKVLGYELGGFRHIDSIIRNVGNSGFSWASTVSGTNAGYLSFYYGNIYPSGANYRGYGLQVRCLVEE